ncbi:hypothetical protein DRA4_0939 [Lactococcus lactis subsp. lactis bv. diacetylactis]|nr:hypothetical protein CVCAS_1498 [Lactococcus lactis subsp. lactis CV56]ARR86896.1 hypothetical protein BSR25_1082 [Lactococcus lactis subsp. lactis bv. diacetylactis]EHE93681.1 hypothetical protein LLCRE1631_01119 [Lactococcus lactis subsp. lactis CNCM I-1631]KSU30444.1 hypothetical protein ML8_0505 [Lactococcus lactis subsp. lactis]KSU31310.1 hypothetical protein NCDO895_0187 [Lactococcus lactis subsp. lactis]
MLSSILLKSKLTNRSAFYIFLKKLLTDLSVNKTVEKKPD